MINLWLFIKGIYRNNEMVLRLLSGNGLRDI